MTVQQLFEIEQSVRNVLNSSFSSREISDYCDISYTTINELKNNKRELGKLNFNFYKSLYYFADNHGLTQSFLDAKEQKGQNNFVPIDIPLKKILVSFDEYDLFALGYLKDSSTSELALGKINSLEQIEPATSLFIDTRNRMYNSYDFGYQFKCRYGGTGPSNFVRFLLDYSNISRSELEQIIFSNAVVEYDFETDSIVGQPSKIDELSMRIHSYNNKLIIVLDKYDNAPRYINDKVTLKNAPSDIAFLETIFQDKYGFDSNLQSISYIAFHESKESQKYVLNASYSTSHDIHIVLEYEQFEIWLPYNLGQDKGNIYTNHEYSTFLSELNFSPTQDKGILSQLKDSLTVVKEISKISN